MAPSGFRSAPLNWNGFIYCGAQSTIALAGFENQSNFGQRFRLSAMEFTRQQEIKRKQIGSALDNSAVEAG
jgi:hypothetical protein